MVSLAYRAVRFADFFVDFGFFGFFDGDDGSVCSLDVSGSSIRLDSSRLNSLILNLRAASLCKLEGLKLKRPVDPLQHMNRGRFPL